MKSRLLWMLGLAAGLAGFSKISTLAETPPLELPVVGIEAKNWRTGEPCPACLVAPASLKVTRSGPTNTAVTVYLETSGAATEGVDYQPVPREVRIPAGATEVELSLAALDDRSVEGPEVAIVRLIDPPFDHLDAIPTYRIGLGLDTALVTILDDEEGAPNARMDIIAPDPAFSVFVRGGEAIEVSALGVVSNDEIFSSVEFYSGEIKIGRTSERVVDAISMPGRALIHSIQWTNPPAGVHSLTARTILANGASLVSPAATITVRNTPLPVVSIKANFPESPEYCPPNALCVGLGFTISRSGPIDQPLRVGLQASGSATAGVDYTPFAETALIPAGESSVYVVTGPIDDKLVEGSETVALSVRPLPEDEYALDPTQSRAFITIIDNETILRDTVVSVTEQDAVTSETSVTDGLDMASFRISRTGSLSDDLPVFFSLGGSAAEGEDYQLPERVARIPAGESSVLVEFRAMFDEVEEGMETVLIRVEPSPMAGPLPAYRISERADSAAAVILERAEDTRMHVEIASPGDGSKFGPDEAIEIIAAAWHPEQLIGQVEFYDGEQKIGDSIVATVQVAGGGAVTHRFLWAGRKAPGIHALTARVRGSGTRISSRPVRVQIEAGADSPLVSIAATRRIAEEKADPLRRVRLTGEFTITRSGGSERAFPIFVEYSGSATPGRDYPMQSAFIVLPAGKESATISIEATVDNVSEPIETIVAKISNCPADLTVPMQIPCAPFRVDPAKESATVFLRDDGVTQATIAMHHPPSGAAFPHGAPVHIEATAIDLDSYISRVEFYAGEKLIGESRIDFIRAPDPGSPIHHSFTWDDAPAGQHVITVRSTDSNGNKVSSPPVSISVGRMQPSGRLVLTGPKEGAVFQEGESILLEATAADAFGYISAVEFLADGQVIGSSQLNFVTAPEAGAPLYHRFEWKNAPLGRHTLTARATSVNDGKVVSGPVRITVTRGLVPPGPQIVITAPENGAVFNEGSAIQIDATATDPGGYISALEFYSNGKLIGVSRIDFIVAPEPGTPIHHTLEWRGASFGPHLLTARAAFSTGGRVESRPVRITVLRDSEARAQIEIDKPGAGERFVAGTVIPVTATAIDRDGYISEVEFFAGKKSIGVSRIVFIRAPDPGSPIYHAIEWKDAPVGGHVLTAQAVKADGSKLVSRAVPITVTANADRPPQVEIVTPAKDSEFPINTVIEITASGVAPDGYIPMIEFFVNGRKIGEQHIDFFQQPAPGQKQQFSFEWKAATPGEHRLTAQVTDDQGVSAVSEPVPFRVISDDTRPLVSVRALAPYAVEPAGTNPVETASFLLTRYGSLASELSVAYTLAGTAENGVDYERLSGTAVFRAGEKSAQVTVKPLADNAMEGIETVILQLKGAAGADTAFYQFEDGQRAVVTISDLPLPASTGQGSVIALPEGLRTVSFRTAAQGAYRVEASSDLKNWETVGQTTGSADSASFVDGNAASFELRFYRIVPESNPAPAD